MITYNRKVIKWITVSLISLISFSAQASPAGKDTLGIKHDMHAGLYVSTMGFGGSVTRKIVRRLDVRLNGSYLGYTYDIHKISKDLQGDAVLKVGTVGGNVDFYVFRFLYFSGGLSYNLTNVALKAEKAESLNVGDIVLEPKDIGTLSVVITPGSKIDPYFGMGFNFRREKNLNFGIEFGLFLQGAPKVKLQATGMLEPTASAEQEQIIEQNISPIIYYPNVSLRISYRIKL